MIIKNLQDTPFTEIVHCLEVSFADYFVKMPSDTVFWQRRWKGARANLRYSYAMFDEGKLVGFMIHGIDEMDSLKTAFNTGTGVIPTYRGHRIVKKMYEFAIPELKAAGVQKLSLEVIQENEKAIKAYRSVGFEITKSLQCYQGELSNLVVTDFNVNQKPLREVDWQDYPPQNRFAWDYHKNGLLLFDELWQCFDVFKNEKRIAYFIIYPKNGTLAQFDVFIDNEQNWLTLFAAVQQVTNTVRINNIDNRQVTKIKALEDLGLKNTINQYEMEVNI